MGKIKLIIDWDGRNYASCTEDDNIACVATGKTLEGVKTDMEDALRQHIDWMKEDGDAIPEEFLGIWEIEWEFTTRAQLHYSESFITRKALAAATGIKVQQLSHYANGWRNPRPDMQRRITDGIRDIRQKLAVIS